MEFSLLSIWRNWNSGFSILEFSGEDDFPRALIGFRYFGRNEGVFQLDIYFFWMVWEIERVKTVNQKQ